MDGSGRPSSCRTRTRGTGIRWRRTARRRQTPLRGSGGVKPFLMQSSSQFRSPGPYLRSPAPPRPPTSYEVKAIGGDGVVTPSTRTADQTYIAKWWQSNPVASWNDVARQLIARNHLDISDTARLLAMENLAAADAAINTWNDKYHFSFWRPFQAIRRAADDGNSATSPDLNLDAAHLRALPRTHVGTPGARRLAHRRAADVLRRRARRGLPDHERIREPRRSCDADVQQLLASGRRNRRGPHLGGSPLPHRGRARPCSSERTSRISRPRTTSSLWATTDPQAAVQQDREGPRRRAFSLRLAAAASPASGTSRHPHGVRAARLTDY